MVVEVMIIEILWQQPINNNNYYPLKNHLKTSYRMSWGSIYATIPTITTGTLRNTVLIIYYVRAC